MITISGDGFPLSNWDIIAKIGTTVVPVYTLTNTSMQIQVPDNLPEGAQNISLIFFQNEIYMAPTPFTISKN